MTGRRQADKHQDERRMLGTQIKQMQTYALRAGFLDRQVLASCYTSTIRFRIKGISDKRRALFVDLLFNLRREDWALVFPKLADWESPNALDSLPDIIARSRMREGRNSQFA